MIATPEKTTWVRSGNIRLSRSGKALKIGIKIGDTWHNYIANVGNVLDVINKKKEYCQLSQPVAE